jgi:ribosomal protein S18 acetylase RimI-like enzyme
MLDPATHCLGFWSAAEVFKTPAFKDAARQNDLSSVLFRPRARLRSAARPAKTPEVENVSRDKLGKFARMNTITITPYIDAAHRGQVVALWKTAFGYGTAHNKPNLVIDKKGEVDDQLFFVAVDDTAVVGTIMAGYDGHRGWIYSVAVSGSHRRQGIGSCLVSHAERALARKGCMKINLQIMEGNESVTAFYSSLGYSVEKRVSMGKRITEDIPERREGG